jgi:Spy/CpxP family protein refolding chaperone
MKTQLLVWGITASSLILGGCGHGPGHGRHEMSVQQINRHLEVLFDYLDARADQRAQIQRQLAGLAGDAVALHQAHRRERAELLAELSRDQLDARALRARVDRRLDQLRGVAYKLVDAAVDVHRILTPAQRAKLTKLLAARMAD